LLLSPHLSHRFGAFLDREFPDLCVGKGGAIPWAHHSPDMTPLDSFFWEFVKSFIYSYREEVQM
jgi:hypothetical protein